MRLANHPIHLALRFFLELFGLFALGNWGWTQHTGLARLLWTVGLPLLAATLWGVFRVPGDSGKAPVAVPGLARLLLEAVYFGGATWALWAARHARWALVFGIVVLANHLVSYEHILWMLKR